MAARSAGGAGAAVTAMTRVAAHVHQDHAAEQPGVEHGREGQDAGNDEHGDNDRHQKPRQQPPGSTGRGLDSARRDRLRAASVSEGGRIVSMSRHGRLTSKLNVVLAPRLWRAAMNRAMASAATPSPIN